MSREIEGLTVEWRGTANTGTLFAFEEYTIEVIESNEKSVTFETDSLLDGWFGGYYVQYWDAKVLLNGKAIDYKLKGKVFSINQKDLITPVAHISAPYIKLLKVADLTKPIYYSYGNVMLGIRDGRLRSDIRRAGLWTDGISVYDGWGELRNFIPAKMARGYIKTLINLAGNKRTREEVVRITNKW